MWKARIRRQCELFLDTGKITSFAQFGEDAFLLGYFEKKAFAAGARSSPLGRPSIPTGYYVDIGAYSPKHFSNSYLSTNVDGAESVWTRRRVRSGRSRK